MKYEHKYDDIIDMEHHVSEVHPQMSLYNRSAQFSKFDALNGLEDIEAVQFKFSGHNDDKRSKNKRY